MTTFSDLLKVHYETTPDKVSVTILHGGQPDLPVSYCDLIQGASGYVKTYIKNGIQPGEVVLLILQHGIDLLYAYYGAILHGAIPSIMPFLTEKLLPERYRADLAALISVTQPAALVLSSPVRIRSKQLLSVNKLMEHACPILVPLAVCSESRMI